MRNSKCQCCDRIFYYDVGKEPKLCPKCQLAGKTDRKVVHNPTMRGTRYYWGDPATVAEGVCLHNRTNGNYKGLQALRNAS